MTEALILGGTGKTGRRVIDRLLSRDVRVRAGSRHPEAAPAGAVPTAFDWDDLATWAAAADGVDAVYLVPPTLRVDHAELVGHFVATLAEAPEPPRVVDLSARGVDADDSIPLRRIELSLDASGLRHAVIRPAWFMQNFTEGYFGPGVSAGVVAVPAGSGESAFVDADDIADVAAALLLRDDLDGAAYDLSGPAAMTWSEAADALTDVVGHPVRYEDVDPDQWVRSMVGAGLDADYATLLASLFAVIRNGWDAQVSTGVEDVLGRPARSFEDWAGSLRSREPRVA